MNNAAVAIPNNKKNTMFRIVDGGYRKKYTKNGEVKKTRSNRVVGVSSEVYAFRTLDEIKAMMNVFNQRIKETNGVKHKTACRNKLLFVIGINVGIRAGDLRSLKWSFFFDEDEDGKRTFKDSYKIQPEKQRKSKKFVTMYFNNAVKKMIEQYVKEYPVDDIDSYLFMSRQGNEPITTAMLWKVIKDTASEAGIEQNIGSHSLRKTWGFWEWHEAEDKEAALVILQNCFNHSDTRTTMKYIGLLDSEIKDMYNNINLGMDFI